MHENNKTLVKISVALLVISSLVLPAGSFFGVPVKYIAYILCLYSLSIEWIKGTKVDVGIIGLFLSICVFITFFLLVSSLRAVSAFGLALSEGSGFFTSITVVLLIQWARSIKAMKDLEIIVSAFYGVLVFAFWKTVVVLLMVTKIVSYADIYLFFYKYVGYTPVTDVVYGDLIRFNFIIYDFIVAFFLFLVPSFPKIFSPISFLTKVFFMVVGTACVIFAFSRLLFALVAVLWIYSLFFKFSFRLRLIALFVVVTTFVLSAPWIEGAYRERFVDVKSEYSDSIRIDQIGALIHAWEDLPILGGGLGFYAKDYIRSPAAPYSYEVQWVSFIAKFGVLGISFLIFLVILLFLQVMRGKRSADHYVLLFILSSFILGGFTNQYLLNAASGIFYSLHLLLSAELRKHEKFDGH